MDAPPLFPSKYQKDTMTNPDIPTPIKVSGQPQGLTLLILNFPPTPIILYQFQHNLGFNKQKHYAPHCLSPVTSTDPPPMKDPMIKIITQHIQ